ncbi:MAG: molybdenum cofactor guanylyltransferase [Cellulosilyticaceae bacterium]
MSEKRAMLLLTGGKSSRMGKPKALLTIDGIPFWQKLASEMAKCGQVYLSVAREEEAPSEAYPLIEDTTQDIGPLGGIYAALQQLEEEAVFVGACDMPLLNETFIQQMWSYMTLEWEGVVVADASGRYYATAAIYTKAMLPVIEQMMGEANYRLGYLLRHCKVKVVTMEALGLDEKMLMNVNTPEEYEALDKA